jgi:hypothetical protein
MGKIGTIAGRDLRDLLIFEKYRGFTIGSVRSKTISNEPWNSQLNFGKSMTCEEFFTA